MTDLNCRVAFVGLGTMGAPMAASLLRAGWRVSVVPHRSRAAAEELEALGAQVINTAAEAVVDTDFFVTMLPTVTEVREVLMGNGGAATSAAPEVLFIDMSTIGPGAARSLAASLARLGLGFIDAPVSGGPGRAASGDLTIMAGGTEGDLDRAGDVLAAMGRQVFHVGGVGTGQTAKACNNLLVAACMLANVEALALGASTGIDPTVLHEIITASSGTNWQLENIVPQTVLRDDFSPLFALPLLRKDLTLAADIAAASGAAFHVGALARQLFAEADEEREVRDFSSVVHLYEAAVGGGNLAAVARAHRATQAALDGAGSQ